MENIEIGYRNIADAINNQMITKSDEALDEIFNKDSKEASWIQPTMKSKDELINAVKLASDKINENEEKLIIIADGDLKRLLEFLYISSDSEKDIYFLGDSLSTLDYAEAIKAMDKNDFSIIAISDGNESTEMICAFTLARKALFKKYSLDKAQEKVYVIAPNGSSYFMKEAAENKYVRLHYNESVLSPGWLMTPAALLPADIMGIETEDLIGGYEDMVTSLIWDKDGRNLSNVLCEYDIKCTYSEIEFKPFVEYLEQRIEKRTVIKENKMSAIVDLSVEETNRDIIIPTFPGCNPEGSMKLMAEDYRKVKLNEYGEKGFPIIEIRLNEFNAKSLGSLIYYIEISIAILNRLKK
ncbi:MAG TPA: hypothetical protein VJ916_06850 [Anaerovoracaceae bacterium]|nr:hypothetical protein [Anaerovoracaceae bacterium]